MLVTYKWAMADKGLTFDRFSLLSPAAKCWIFLLFSTMGNSHNKSDHRNIASAWIYVELAVPKDYILHLHSSCFETASRSLCMYELEAMFSFPRGTSGLV